MRRNDTPEDSWSALWNGDAAHDVQATGMLSAIVAPLGAAGLPANTSSVITEQPCCLARSSADDVRLRAAQTSASLYAMLASRAPGSPEAKPNVSRGRKVPGRAGSGISMMFMPSGSR